MANLVLDNEVRIEGNSIFITSYPTVGILGLTSFIDVVEGEDATHQFVKTFTYSTDGIHYSNPMPLTAANLTGLQLKAYQVVKFELQYYKSQPAGEDQLKVNSVAINYNAASLPQQDIFNNTVFKEFFESTDPKVLNWYINVLNKLYKKGLIADYIVRDNNTNDSDFITFWSSIAKFFAYYVVYARQFQNFHQSEALLSEFLEQRGLQVSDSSTLEEMNQLMQSYYFQLFQRGTIHIVDKKSEGADYDGEMLRLLWYRENEDEFIFNPRLPQHLGWNISNSSPLYKGMKMQINANKMPEKEKLSDSSFYPNASIITDGGKQVLYLANNSMTINKKFKISPALNYQFTFLIKSAGLITVSIQTFDKNNTLVSTKSYRTGLDQDKFLNRAKLYRGDKYLPIELLLYNSQKPLFDKDLTQIHQGEDLKMENNVVWASVTIAIEGEANIGDLKFIPQATPYSHGLIQTNNLIDAFVVNRNNYYTFRQACNYVSKYLIPYNSHMSGINLKDAENQDLTKEKEPRKTQWVADKGYCETTMWVGINPSCETITTRWIGEESSAYCKKSTI